MSSNDFPKDDIFFDILGMFAFFFFVFFLYFLVRSPFELSLDDYEKAYNPDPKCSYNCVERTDYFIASLDAFLADGSITYAEFYFIYLDDKYKSYSLSNDLERSLIEDLKHSRGL